MSGLLIVLIVVVVLAVLLIGIYNRLVALRQNCNQAFADVDVQLKQRHDLIPNLVETVKGYAAHESGTLEAVIQARNSAVSAERTGIPKRWARPKAFSAKRSAA
ncbi:MAG: LemA family protein [Hyphomonadaceae bacterium JAD_PAG50586_4]|nr:MAG: LemA family protein [Hyphomonadaceae bacterium JAD_PAG50586_4]